MTIATVIMFDKNKPHVTTNKFEIPIITEHRYTRFHSNSYTCVTFTKYCKVCIDSVQFPLRHVISEAQKEGLDS